MRNDLCLPYVGFTCTACWLKSWFDYSEWHLSYNRSFCGRRQKASECTQWPPRDRLKLSLQSLMETRNVINSQCCVQICISWGRWLILAPSRNKEEIKPKSAVMLGRLGTIKMPHYLYLVEQWVNLSSLLLFQVRAEVDTGGLGDTQLVDSWVQAVILPFMTYTVVFML